MRRHPIAARPKIGAKKPMRASNLGLTFRRRKKLTMIVPITNMMGVLASQYERLLETEEARKAVNNKLTATELQNGQNNTECLYF